MGTKIFQVKVPVTSFQHIANCSPEVWALSSSCWATTWPFLAGAVWHARRELEDGMLLWKSWRRHELEKGKIWLMCGFYLWLKGVLINLTLKMRQSSVHQHIQFVMSIIKMSLCVTNDDKLSIAKDSCVPKMIIFPRIFGRVGKWIWIWWYWYSYGALKQTGDRSRA